MWPACGSFLTWTCGARATGRDGDRLGAAIENRDGPSCLILTRQSLAHERACLRKSRPSSAAGYVLIDSDGPPMSL